MWHDNTLLLILIQEAHGTVYHVPIASRGDFYYSVLLLFFLERCRLHGRSSASLFTGKDAATKGNVSRWTLSDRVASLRKTDTCVCGYRSVHINVRPLVSSCIIRSELLGLIAL